MNAISTQEFSQACQIFLDLAYADGPDSIPIDKRRYYDIPADASIADYLSPAPLAAGVCQDLSKLKSGVPGYEFRLGSSAHPHLKLRIQRMEFQGREVWVYSVNTHDQFHQATKHLSAEHAEAWRALVEQNSLCKHRIEKALANAGFMTPIGLLRVDLTTA